jgi:hypothetical protein
MLNFRAVYARTAAWCVGVHNASCASCHVNTTTSSWTRKWFDDAFTALLVVTQETVYFKLWYEFFLCWLLIYVTRPLALLFSVHSAVLPFCCILLYCYFSLLFLHYYWNNIFWMNKSIMICFDWLRLTPFPTITHFNAYTVAPQSRILMHF